MSAALPIAPFICFYMLLYANMKWESYQTLQSNLIYIFVGKFTYEPIFESKRSKFANISLAKASTNRVHSLYSLSMFYILYGNHYTNLAKICIF